MIGVLLRPTFISIYEKYSRIVKKVRENSRSTLTLNTKNPTLSNKQKKNSQKFIIGFKGFLKIGVKVVI